MKKKLAHNSTIKVLFLQTAIMFWYACFICHSHAVIQNNKDMYSRVKISET